MISLATGCGGSSAKSSTQTSSGGGSIYTGGTPGGTPVKGGSITIDQGESVKALDPVVLIQPSEIQVARAMFDGLTEYLPGNPEAQPALAESWKISNGARKFVFHIRSGVKFSNGEPLTGEDVVFTLDRQKLSTAAIGAVIGAKEWKVSLAGPMDVKLETTKPFPSLIGDLGLVQMYIVPKHVVQREGEKAFAAHPVGTGAFELSNATPTLSTVTLKRNPNYWRSGQPYLDGVTFNYVAETNARVLAVRTGGATIGTGISFSQVASLKSTPGVRMLIEPLQDTMPVFFQMGSPPFNDVKVRQALSYATPREEIVKAVFKGLAETANACCGHLKYYDSSVQVPKFEIGKAKQLLKESSSPNGFSTTISIPSGEPDAQLVASILQSTWAQIGVHASIQAVDPSSFFANQFSSKYQVDVWNDEGFVTEQYPDDLTMYINFTEAGGTHEDGSNYKSARVTSLLEKALGTDNEETRRSVFGEAQNALINEEPPLIPVAAIPSRTLVSASLRGFEVLPTNSMRLERVWLSR